MPTGHPQFSSSGPDVTYQPETTNTTDGTVSGNVKPSVLATGASLVAGGSFARPANTTAYTVGQLIANSTTAGSVTPIAIALARVTGGTGRISRIRLSSSNAAEAGAVIRVHVFKTSPTTTVGDGGVFAGAVNGVTSLHIGYFDVTLALAFSDGCKGSGVPNIGSYLTFDAAAGSQNLYLLLESRTAFTPASAATYTPAVETDRD